MASLQAAIFDMDGVVTDTAELHFKSWQLMFDAFLTQYCASHQLTFQPFTQEDYLYYVDGVTRQDGVKSFLASRQINLPTGSPTDTFDQFTLYGLGNQKDRLFQQLLNQKGVKQFTSTVQLIKQLRQQGIKTAIISSSKNCQSILQRAALEPLFDARVDGKLLEQRKIPGKPQPDIFLNAAEILGVEPSNTMIVEDALSGVQAGRAGKFGLVVGIDRQGLGAQIFKEYGANIVVHDLAALKLEGIKHWFNYQLEPVFLNASKLNPTFAQLLSGKQLALLFDFDGTLTPIANSPEWVTLAPATRRCLRQLGAHYPVAIISGRKLSDLQQHINLPNLYYAGNHGLEISGPSFKHSEGSDYWSEMAVVYQQLLAQLKTIPGILIEDKQFSLSIHYRQVADTEIKTIHQHLNQILAQHPNLKRHDGKKVFEIRPNLDWHKGKAVLWLLTKLKLTQTNVLPIYVGDDTTDEDAFRAVKQGGIGIIVANCKQPTAASYCLRNTQEVQQFLELLVREG